MHTSHHAELQDRLPSGIIPVLVSQMKALIAALFQAAFSETSFQPLPNCFELYGIDFVFGYRGDADDALQPQAYLLEVNCGPDLAHVGQRLLPNGIRLYEDVFRVAIDPTFSPHVHMQQVDQTSARATSAAPVPMSVGSSVDGTLFECIFQSQVPFMASAGPRIALT